MSGLLSDMLFDVRRGLRPTLTIVGVVFAGFFLLLALVLGVFYLATGRATPPKSPIDAAIPVTAYAPSVIQVFDCVQTGPSCPYYDKSKQYLMQVVPDEGLTYTPRTVADPGSDGPDGAKVVRLGPATSAADWAAVGKAVTLSGAANETTVTEKNVSMPDAQTATFTVARRTATMKFAVTQESIQIISVIYTAER